MVDGGAQEVEAMIEAEFASLTESSASLGASARSDASAAEPRVILIDGFNVLHAVLLGKAREQGWWRRVERERLLRRIAGWQSGPDDLRSPDDFRSPDDLWVAFDGGQPAWSVWAEPIAGPTNHSKASGVMRGPTVHCVFVESADDWIVRRARRSARPDQMVVVSADRKVAGRARSAGCEIWTPWDFISRCPLPS